MKQEKKQVRTYFLEMLNKNGLTPSSLPDGLSIVKVTPAQPELNQSLYTQVGRPWLWTDKLDWTKRQWQHYLDDHKTQTWVAYVDGKTAGYYELNTQNTGEVELAYFGLMPSFIGKGLGGALLNHALESAWSVTSTKRVWVHTCDLDHPHALKNYQNRGFKLYKTEVEPKE
ncbi:GNAT family N-acetyltransferase [Pseudoalteromonas luteoviolacea]|uniref:N-acetyltransferase domain-containing protein n=1 Tax=Pseudoalteromonas luteoviolacea S4060-1 TaxID=1365257 RepID=A0A167N187_9GAMM|nr:GNAT family N-acetyltransferase [Pseudoalteromonas luteoviolacea]KZN67303.1 hypothetical protein N478_17930 [Pseudoalteromonas luteoviolacea S4060-1]